MKDPKTIRRLLLFSILAAIGLGMLDYETQSLWHLFTSDPGNIVALGFYTGSFMLLGLMGIGIYNGMKNLLT
jgi:hypothetical protein